MTTGAGGGRGKVSTGTDPDRVAVLTSGGLDSAILAADLGRVGVMVFPIYVQHGYLWEAAEREHLERFLGAVDPALRRRLKVLALPLGDVMGEHWGMTGEGVPDATTPDEAVFLPARNALLLAKAMLWCHLWSIRAVALGTLRSNPFPDATPAFFEAFASAMNQAIGGTVGVLRPYAAIGKLDVMRRGRGLPLELTFSCLRPVGGRHCGECNKCEERRLAFEQAGMDDRTEYAAGR